MKQTSLLFVFSFAPACSVLGVAQLDSVIIASPPTEDGVNLSLQHLQPYWEELENLVQSKKIVAIGTSDLDKTQLEQLYQWAQVKDLGITRTPGRPVFHRLCRMLLSITHIVGSTRCGVTIPHGEVLRQALYTALNFFLNICLIELIINLIYNE